MLSENARLTILGMLADGVISAEDALKLLEAMNKEELPPEVHTPEGESNPQESVFCIPGGKCYSLAELKKQEKPEILKLDLDGEPGNAKSWTYRRDQQRN